MAIFMVKVLQNKYEWVNLKSRQTNLHKRYGDQRWPTSVFSLNNTFIKVYILKTANNLTSISQIKLALNFSLLR